MTSTTPPPLPNQDLKGLINFPFNFSSDLSKTNNLHNLYFFCSLEKKMKSLLHLYKICIKRNQRLKPSES